LLREILLPSLLPLSFSGQDFVPPLHVCLFGLTTPEGFFSLQVGIRGYSLSFFSPLAGKRLGFLLCPSSEHEEVIPRAGFSLSLLGDGRSLFFPKNLPNKEKFFKGDDPFFALLSLGRIRPFPRSFPGE